MRHYETLFIVRPDLEQDVVDSIASEVEKMILDTGGVLFESDIWGRKRLANHIKGFAEGIYLKLNFGAETNTLGRLRTFFKMNENVIKHLLVLQEYEKPRDEPVEVAEVE